MNCCSVCGKKLSGTDKGPKTKTRPTRRFGGILCHSCVEQASKIKSRLDDGTITEDQVDLTYKKYIDQMNIKTEPKKKREKK